MSWYYAAAGQQVGPVEEVQLQQLYTAGTLRADSLVWRAGMDGWKPYSQVFLGAPPVSAYGGFWIRVVARLIDGIIVGIASSLVQVPMFFMMGGAGMMLNPDFDPSRNPAFPAAMMGTIGMIWMLSFAIDAAYYTYLTGTRGATFGKMAVGLRVVRADGQPVSMGLAAGRWAANIVSGLTLGIGYIIAGFDSQKRALHDHICNTRVIRDSR